MNSCPCLRHEDMSCSRIRGTAPLILNLGTRLRCVVNVTLRLLYPRERTLVPIFWIWPGRYGEEAYHVPLFEPRII
jgi:hypothetical protein